MFHLISGNLTSYDNQHYISNDLIGIQVTYHGKQEQGTYFLYPIMDEHAKTIKYYAFDTAAQKESFSSVLKISGI
jgi:Holliday junction resolvasome RuvABC DNA-binding subunit